MVVSAVSIGGAEEGLGFVFGLFVLRIKDGVFGVSGGFDASSSLNCEKEILNKAFWHNSLIGAQCVWIILGFNCN